MTCVNLVQQAQEAAAAAVKAQEEEQRLKAAETARQQEELAESQRAMEEQKAKDRARLEASSHPQPFPCSSLLEPALLSRSSRVNLSNSLGQDAAGQLNV